MWHAYLSELNHQVALGPMSERRLHHLCNQLESFLQNRPPLLQVPVHPGEFVGKLLYEDAATGHIVVWMAWGPGASTPIHDHGTWGIMGLLAGQLELTNFVRVQESVVRPVFAGRLEVGDATWLLPPDKEIHRIANPGEDVAYSLHVYGTNIGFSPD